MRTQRSDVRPTRQQERAAEAEDRDQPDEQPGGSTASGSIVAASTSGSRQRRTPGCRRPAERRRVAQRAVAGCRGDRGRRRHRGRQPADLAPVGGRRRSGRPGRHRLGDVGEEDREQQASPTTAAADQADAWPRTPGGRRAARRAPAPEVAPVAGPSGLCAGGRPGVDDQSPAKNGQGARPAARARPRRRPPGRRPRWSARTRPR